jgi:hypothetical protein
MTVQERMEMYRTYLSSEGYSPEPMGDAGVLFRCEGKTYVILPDEKDEMFFRLILPGIWPIESEGERERVIAASVMTTGETKVAKVYPVDDNTWASIEMFCLPADSFKPVFKRAMSALQTSLMTFASKMRS